MATGPARNTHIALLRYVVVPSPVPDILTGIRIGLGPAG